MSELTDIEILVHQYFDGDLSYQEKKDFEERLENDKALQAAVEEHKAVRDELLFVKHREANRRLLSQIAKENDGIIPIKNYKKFMVLGTIAAIFLIGIIIYNPFQSKTRQDIAQHKEEKAEGTKSTETKKEIVNDYATEEVAEAVEGNANSEEQLKADGLGYDYEEIIYDTTLLYSYFTDISKIDTNIRFNFSEQNEATLNAAGLARTPNTLQLNSNERSSTLDYIGVINTNTDKSFIIFNAITIENDRSKSEKSIFIYDGNLKYLGKYIMKNSGQLPSEVLDNKLLFLLEKGENILEHSIDFENKLPDCIELPQEGSYCISKY